VYRCTEHRRAICRCAGQAPAVQVDRLAYVHRGIVRPMGNAALRGLDQETSVFWGHGKNVVVGGGPSYYVLLTETKRSPIVDRSPTVPLAAPAAHWTMLPHPALDRSDFARHLHRRSHWDHYPIARTPEPVGLCPPLPLRTMRLPQADCPDRSDFAHKKGHHHLRTQQRAINIPQ
jgi:hypothetical protein